MRLIVVKQSTGKWAIIDIDTPHQSIVIETGIDSNSQAWRRADILTGEAKNKSESRSNDNFYQNLN